MLLFLDVISPIPEFFIIEENKVIFQRKIIKSESCKLSDHIFETYIKMSNELDFSANLMKIAMTIGPGSYTSLRVGAAFLSGLQISKNLNFCPISVYDIFKFKSEKYNKENFGFYISSAKNQNFFCSMNIDKKIEYIKLEDNDFLPGNINKIFYNIKKLDYKLKKIQQSKFTFIDEILNNMNKLKFTKNSKINPIYISNNKILN
tara:strand:- start:461 stop:1072 length:612 start_codon:yes stop_codon:yes gene_type:complete